MTSLTKGSSFGVSSEFMDAVKVFSPTQKVKVYVEGYDDISFWKDRFSKFNVEVEIVAYVMESNANGKGTIIRDIRGNNLVLGKNLLVALDSDYDYLMDKNTDIFNNEFVFQTYSYSIENLLWHPSRLDRICKTAACNDHLIGDNDISKSMSDWSEKVYPEFVRLMHSGANDSSAFDNLISTINVDVTNHDYDELNFDDLDESYSASLSSKGVQRNNVFLFVRGHDIESRMESMCQGVVTRTFDRVKEELQNRHGGNAGQHIGEFKKKQTEPRILVKVGEISCSLCIPKIDEDIVNYKETCH